MTTGRRLHLVQRISIERKGKTQCCSKCRLDILPWKWYKTKTAVWQRKDPEDIMGAYRTYFLNSQQGLFSLSYENEDFCMEGECIEISDTGTDSQHSYHQTQLHTHPIYEAHIILKGNSAFETRNGEVLTVNAGNFVIFSPEDPHRVLSESSSFSKLLLYYAFSPKNTETGRRYAKVGAFLQPASVYASPADALVLTEYMLRLYHKQGIDYRANLLFLFLSLHGSLVDAVAAAHGEEVQSCDARVSNAIAFIQRNITANLNVAQTAEQVGLSGKQLNRLFCKELGSTVGAYIDAVKHKRIRQFLADPEYSLQDIADIMQYSDLLSFSRAFKRLEGVTPSQYRKNSGNSMMPMDVR